jgi:signal transduction histidine kinase
VEPQTNRTLTKLGELFHRQKGVVLVTAAFLLAIVACFDYITSIELSFSIFYLIPISLVAWYVGLRAGLLTSVVGAVIWFTLDSIISRHLYSNPSAKYWNALVRFGFFIIVTVILSRLKISMDAIRAQSREMAVAYAELDRVRKEQLIMKDRILSHVSHELRTPLTALHQFVTILLDGLAGDINPEQKEYLEIALKNANQLNEMIEDLLESTRIDSGKMLFHPVAVSLQSIMDEIRLTLRSMALEKKISVTVDIDADLPRLSADPVRVRQVLLNLLDNALKFTPEGGAIKVRGGVFERDPQFVCVSVTDTGTGISPEGQKNLFQRLLQEDNVGAASRKGLGLGLYICKEIISRHHGNIWVDSQPGRGTTFYFTLPVQAYHSRAATAPAEGEV